MNLIIRRAVEEEVGLIQQLNNELINFEMDQGFDSYVKDWALSNESKEYFLDLIKDQFVLVAEVENKIIGYIAGSIYNDLSYSYYEGKTAEANNMFVKQEFRHLGVGKKLFTCFIDWCKSNNAKRIMVTASSGNANAIKFYKSMGFDDINLTLKKEL